VRADAAAESLRGPLVDAGRESAASPGRPTGPSVPALTWTPLPDASPSASAPPASPPLAPEGEVEARDASAGTSILLETLRRAPGVLAEAWSAIEAALRAIRAGLGTAGGEQLDIYGRDARLSEAVAPLVDFLYSRWFRVEVEGAANVPAGGALLVANHAGALPLDGPMLHEALRRERPELPEARWLAEDQVFYAPLLGTLFNRLGAVRASPDSATRLLGEGRPVLIFPEGIQGIGKPFRDRYRLQRFGRGGFVKLALRTGKPILPVAIMGAEETLPLLGKLPGGPLGVPYLPVTGPLPLPAKWRIRIGEPLVVPAGARETDSSVVESMVEATRNTIEHMLRGLLGARGGVFLG
jgi:1-acyl-sn-glycerol-3-phosphate acyltransferase